MPPILVDLYVIQPSVGVKTRFAPSYPAAGRRLDPRAPLTWTGASPPTLTSAVPPPLRHAPKESLVPNPNAHHHPQPNIPRQTSWKKSPWQATAITDRWRLAALTVVAAPHRLWWWFPFLVPAATLLGHRHVPEGGGGRPAAGPGGAAATGHGVPDERRGRGLLPGGRRDGGAGGAGAGARRRLVHRPLRLLRRLQQLLRDVPVPVHHVRAGRGDHRPGVDVVRHQRGALHAHHAAHRLPVRLLLLLPRQDARPVRPPGEPLRRLLRPLVLRVLRPLPGVPRAQEARVRHEARMACKHGEAGAHRRHHAAADAPRDDPLKLPLAGLCCVRIPGRCYAQTCIYPSSSRARVITLRPTMTYGSIM